MEEADEVEKAVVIESLINQIIARRVLKKDQADLINLRMVQ